MSTRLGVCTESVVRIHSSMVKSSSPTARPGVEAGTSTNWSLPLKRAAEPTRPGTRSGWNIGSSKVNHADRFGGTGAQRGWAAMGRVARRRQNGRVDGKRRHECRRGRHECLRHKVPGRQEWLGHKLPGKQEWLGHKVPGRQE
ncbi:hypothetical protein SBA4_1510004 [Candidatus Sulfopaludibacter sp. SbA4]|nr:hypothetical protein SBA4_1510004 [Candidatus Sulfopaludibacter sp. SbA4]